MRIKRRNKNGVLFLISILLLVLITGGVVTYIGEKMNLASNSENNITISKEIELRTGPVQL